MRSCPDPTWLGHCPDYYYAPCIPINQTVFAPLLPKPRMRAMGVATVKRKQDEANRYRGMIHRFDYSRIKRTFLNTRQVRRGWDFLPRHRNVSEIKVLVLYSPIPR